MRVEALSLAPANLNGIAPESFLPSLSEIPYHLRKRTLKQIRRENGTVPETLWEERGEQVEKRVSEIVRSQTDIVSEVTINPKYTKGSDLRVKFTEGFPLPEIHIEVKSSSIGIKEYKQKIRDSLPPKERQENGVRKWLTNNNIILINGTEEKSVEEILFDSFYPQLERIWQKALREQTPEPSGQLVLFTTPNPI